MVVRGSLKGGTDFTEEGLKPSDLQDTFDAFYVKSYSDNTGGSTTSTSETDLATLTVTQNDLGSTAVFECIAGIRIVLSPNIDTDTNKTGTFKLYVNGSAVKTITLTTGADQGNADPTGTGTCFAHLSSAVDVTAGNVIIKVTGQSSVSRVECFCDNLLVRGINNNS